MTIHVQVVEKTQNPLPSLLLLPISIYGFKTAKNWHFSDKYPWCMIIKKVAKCQKNMSPKNIIVSVTAIVTRIPSPSIPPPLTYWKLIVTPTFTEQRRPAWSLSTAQNNIYYHHPLLVMLNWYIVLSLLKQKLMMNKITFFTKTIFGHYQQSTLQ